MNGIGKAQAAAAIILVVAAVIASFSIYTVAETQQAIVLQFGEPVRTVREPGIHVKLPFVQNVEYLEKRVLDLDPPPDEVLLGDQRRLKVDLFGRYRIADPLEYFRRVRTERIAESRLNTFMNASMRGVLGNTTLTSLLSEERAALMEEIRKRVNQEALGLGIEMVDVRIGRADLPEQINASIYARMAAERKREAEEARAQGKEIAQQIESRANREATVIKAEARRNAEILRGEGDRKAIAIYAEALSRDPDFYGFYRTMEAYRKALAGDSTTFVLTPDSDFFRYFRDIEGRVATPEGAPPRAAD